MNPQQAVAKRSVGRRVTLLDAPFFCLFLFPRSHVSVTERSGLQADAQTCAFVAPQV
jgi:hypothetical protein